MPGFIERRFTGAGIKRGAEKGSGAGGKGGSKPKPTLAELARSARRSRVSETSQVTPKNRFAREIVRSGLPKRLTMHDLIATAKNEHLLKELTAQIRAGKKLIEKRLKAKGKTQTYTAGVVSHFQYNVLKSAIEFQRFFDRESMRDTEKVHLALQGAKSYLGELDKLQKVPAGDRVTEQITSVIELEWKLKYLGHQLAKHDFALASLSQAGFGREYLARMGLT